MTNYPHPQQVCLHLDLILDYTAGGVRVLCEWCGRDAEYPNEFLLFSPDWIRDSFVATFGEHHRRTPEQLRICQSWPVCPL